MRCLAVAVALLSAGASAANDFGRYHALVIGNNDYQHLPKLETAVNDATAMAELLREKYGYTVTLLKDATRADILRAFNRFRAELTENDNLLVYYAGHGTLDRATDTGYWLPVDAEPDSDLNWVPNEAISRHLRGMTARHVMVIADSCYSGTLVRDAQAAPATGRERNAWLTRMAEIRSRTAITSGGLEPVVDAGGGGHSVFAGALLKALRANAEIIEGSALFGRISRGVVVNADQTPAYSDIRKAGHEGGEFLFVPQGQRLPGAADETETAAVPATPTDPAGRAALETAFWQTIQNSDRPADFEAYLTQFPDGTFAALARIRLAALNRPTTPSAGVTARDDSGLTAGTGFRDCDDCPEMVVIPPGRFAMGAAPDLPEAGPEERPQHDVVVGAAFAMAKYEVSRAEFERFAEAQGGVRDPWCSVWADGGWRERAFGRQFPGFDQSNADPVVCVSWRTARQYAQWLSRETRQRYRLPSEAEWEYAARAGAVTPRPWGYDADRACAHANGADLSHANDYWFEGRQLHGCRDDFRRTAPTGSFEPNGFGLHDMLGNAAEWVADCWHDDYLDAGSSGAARDATDCRGRTVRGGGWADGPLALRLTARRGQAADRPQAGIGFRLVRVLDGARLPAGARVAAAGSLPTPPSPYVATPAALTALSGAAHVVTADTERRLAPTDAAPKLGRLRAGDIVTATLRTADGEWTAVAQDDVALGFVPSAHLAAAATGHTAPGFAAGQTIRDCADCPEMVVLPPGRIAMGMDAAAVEVTIPRAFAIGKYEVTFDEWAACVEDGACRDGRDNGWGRGKRPVVVVHWREGLNYARWLSEKTGQRYRLPSEAEWEYAARAGTDTTRYWGDDPATACRFANVADRSRGGDDAGIHACDDGFAETAPVGSFAANAFGLHDMLGNASEWVDDCWNETLAAMPRYGAPHRGGKCAQRLLRGGSAADGPAAIQSGYRGRHLNAGLSGGATDRHAGLRVVRELE